jgi:hypothetical protein
MPEMASPNSNTNRDGHFVSLFSSQLTKGQSVLPSGMTSPTELFADITKTDIMCSDYD